MNDKLVCGVGIKGSKYPSRVNNVRPKEYSTWKSMLRRCFDEKIKNNHSAYRDVTCCKEWLSYENFYEWLHSQENFDKWLNGDLWHLDKDILVKGNKTYSPETCCLVPINVNVLFVRKSATRGNSPIGVREKNNGFEVHCRNPIINKKVYIGTYKTKEEAFIAYKQYKEEIIKQVAQIEFDNGNIPKRCYDAMVNYEVEITD